LIPTGGGLAPRAWRRALGLGLLGLGLAGGIHLFDEAPSDHRLVLRAPTGARVRSLELTLLDAPGGEPRAGARYAAAEPALRVEHVARVPDGTYMLELTAVLERDGAKSSTVRGSFPLELGAGQVELTLPTE
jgi:hypothetical protein